MASSPPLTVMSPRPLPFSPAWRPSFSDCTRITPPLTWRLPSQLTASSMARRSRLPPLIVRAVLALRALLLRAKPSPSASTLRAPPEILSSVSAPMPSPWAETVTAPPEMAT